MQPEHHTKLVDPHVELATTRRQLPFLLDQSSDSLTTVTAAVQEIDAIVQAATADRQLLLLPSELRQLRELSLPISINAQTTHRDNRMRQHASPAATLAAAGIGSGFQRQVRSVTNA